MTIAGPGNPAQPAMLASFARSDNGFNTIRLLAALAVIVSHAFPLVGMPEPVRLLTNGQTDIGNLAVAAFFLISGYLISASLDRSTLAQFALKRARRIMPGLIVAVLISALVVGSLATRLPLGDYLTSSATWRYLGNAVFLPVGQTLPGVFEGQVHNGVNASLWTLKFEVACYIAVPLLFALKRWRKAVVVLAWLFSFPLARLLHDDTAGLQYYVLLTATLFRFFGAGMVCYLFADRIALNARLAWAALVVTVGAAFTPVFLEVTSVAGSYALMTFAYLAPAGFRQLTARGDISYGVYVYAYPIQQLLAPVALGFAVPWLANVALTLPLVLLAGLLSWVIVEKPALQWGRKTARVTPTTSPPAP